MEAKMDIDDRPVVPLADLEKELLKCEQAIADARQREDEASRNKCAALNAYNRAAKAIDEYMARLRKEAPIESAWASIGSPTIRRGATP